MKVNIKRGSGDTKYPCIMESISGTIVLMTEHGIGTILEQGETSSPVGKTLAHWVMETFKPFDGEITLRN